MRLDINLASQPYEDARQFWLRWGAAVCALGLLTLVLLTMDVTGWINARRDHTAIASVRAMIADRDQIRANAERRLSLPENRTIRDESQLLNELIERKAFSWTLVLENLEKVMPPRVHVVAIHPELNEDNQLALKMTVAGDSRDRAIELARRMEGSQRFEHTEVVTERYSQSTSGDTEQFEMTALYIPEAPAAAEPVDTKSKTDQNPKTGVKNPKAGVKPTLRAKPQTPASRENKS